MIVVINVNSIQYSMNTFSLFINVFSNLYIYFLFLFFIF